MVAGAWIVIASGTPAERTVPVAGRLLVGRECRGADPERCLILDDPAISRDHLEIRFDARGPVLIDLSTNGTWVNGRRVERGDPVGLHDGDSIELGSATLGFHVTDLPEPVQEALQSTLRLVGATQLAIVVGDIVGYTGLTELHGGVAVATTTEELFAGLRGILTTHHGTVSNYLGDAIFGAWDARRNKQAAAAAVRFALAAHELVSERAESLPLRSAGGAPIQMGWAVTFGEAGVVSQSPGREAVHGDAVNLAFRLAGLAARAGNPAVLVSEEAAAQAPAAARYGEPRQLSARGRSAAARVHEARRA